MSGFMRQDEKAVRIVAAATAAAAVHGRVGDVDVVAPSPGNNEFRHDAVFQLASAKMTPPDTGSATLLYCNARWQGISFPRETTRSQIYCKLLVMLL
jgi:hypothetical protein